MQGGKAALIAVSYTHLFVFVSGNPGSMPAGSMLLHVVNHATYHRGWLVQMYFEIPAMPPLTDLSVYLTECQTWPAGSC